MAVERTYKKDEALGPQFLSQVTQIKEKIVHQNNKDEEIKSIADEAGHFLKCGRRKILHNLAILGHCLVNNCLRKVFA